MNCRTLSSQQRGPYLRLTLQAPGIARRARPGQFVTVRVPGRDASFWRRPFSICRADGGRIELLIKVVGPTTHALAALRAGDPVDVLGPLGRGFTLTGREDRVLVGGGYGIAPLLFLAERLRARGRAVTVLQGGRCAGDLLLRPELRRTGAPAMCTTEDGSAGRRGRVTVLLEERLRATQGPILIAACGPHAMLASVAKLAARYRVPAEVSLEALMACGLGVCNGCVQKVAGAYRRVCHDGPVFAASEVTWDA